MKKKLNYIVPSIGDVLLVALFLAMSFSPKFVLLGDADTGWHIRIGEFILDNFFIPDHDIFSYVTPPLPWTTAEWLSEVIMAVLHGAFGLNGVVIFFAFLISLIYYLLFRMIRRYKGNILIDIFIILIVIVSSMLHWLARPHIISAVLFLISYYILDNFQDNNNKNYLYLLPPIMLCWVNLHGAFISGFILIGIYLISNSIIFFISNGTKKEESKKKTKILSLIALLCILISFLNPHGYNIFVYPFKVLSNQYLMDHIIEFLSPNFHEFSVIPFRYLLLLVITIIAITRNELKFTELFLILLFTNMALYSARYILLFSVVVAPILSRHCKLLFKQLKGKAINWLQKKSEEIAAIDATSRGYLWVIPLALIFPLVFGGGLDHRFDDKKKPVAAVEFLKKEFLKGNMFNEYAFGGYIVYSAYPQYKVFIHGKIDWRGEEKFKEYYKIALFESGWEDLIEKYNINWIIFDTDSALSRFLKERNDWRIIYTDKVASIFVRNVSDNFDIIKKYCQPLSPAN
jgi:hypothetical protein